MNKKEISRRDFFQTGLGVGMALALPEMKPSGEDIRVEAMRRGLDREYFLADKTEVLLTKPNGQEIALTLNNVDFSLTEIETNQRGEIQEFAGYIYNMTGDNVTARVPIAGLYNYRSGWQYHLNARCARTWEQSITPDSCYFSYLLLAKETIYDNKVFNILKALNDFRKNAITGFGPGEEISYLEMIELGEHVIDIYKGEGDLNYYLPGYAVNEEGVLVRMIAGGVCASVATTAKPAYKAQKAGLVKITEVYSHASGFEYRVNPLDTDTIDATAFFENRPGKSYDLKMKNTSDRRLYWIPRADVVLPVMEDGRKLFSSMRKPATCWLAISMAITDVPPTLESSQSVEESLQKFTEFRLEYGNGSHQGFELW